MPRRPWRGGFGLQSRIVGVVLITTAATLVVAAVALLGALQNQLRTAALSSLQTDLGRHPSAPFEHLRLTDLGVLAKRRATSRELQKQLRLLSSRTGAGTITFILGYPGLGSSARGVPIGTAVPGDTDLPGDSLQDVVRAFRTDRRVPSFGLIDGAEFVRVSVPFRSREGLRFVLAVRRSAGEISQATQVVRKAFTTAALAALALTLLLAIPVSARLVRRLRRLRQAALELAQSGPGVEVPVDRARDEVGDLARSFAIMQEQLRHQEEARRAFVATASHELRTPLTSLDGMLELLDEDLRSPQPDLADARSLLGRSRVQSRRLGRLAADLLDLSRLDAEVRLRSEPVELSELSRAVLAEFELGTAERGIRTVLDDRAGQVWVRADPGSVARILRILLDNAVRVSPAGSTITVELEDARSPLLRVRDEGPGVAAEEREAIFERFRRGRDTAGQAGFGLGLAIGRELAGRMKGELELEDGEGGASFVLCLPGAPAPQEESVSGT